MRHIKKKEIIAVSSDVDSPLTKKKKKTATLTKRHQGMFAVTRRYFCCGSSNSNTIPLETVLRLDPMAKGRVFQYLRRLPLLQQVPFHVSRLEQDLMFCGTVDSAGASDSCLHRCLIALPFQYGRCSLKQQQVPIKANRDHITTLQKTNGLASMLRPRACSLGRGPAAATPRPKWTRTIIILPLP